MEYRRVIKGIALVLCCTPLVTAIGANLLTDAGKIRGSVIPPLKSSSHKKMLGYTHASSVMEWYSSTSLVGPQGPQGERGFIGMTGARGPAGADGVIGHDGADGAQGPQGIQGVPGADGLTTSVNGVTHVGGAITLTPSDIGAQPAGSYATSAQGAKADTAVQNARFNIYSAARAAEKIAQDAAISGKQPSGSYTTEAPNDANAYVRAALGWVVGYTKTAIDNLISGLSSIYVSLTTYNTHTASTTAHGLRPATFSNLSTMATAALSRTGANAFAFTVYSSPTCTSTLAIDPANGEEQKIVLGGACTGTISLASAGTARKLFLRVKQPVAGHQTMSLKYTGGTNVKWPSGSVPTFTNTSSAVDYIACRVYSGWASCAPSQDMK